MYDRILPQSVESVIALDSYVLILKVLIVFLKAAKTFGGGWKCALVNMAFEQSEWYKDQASKSMWPSLVQF